MPYLLTSKLVKKMESEARAARLKDTDACVCIKGCYYNAHAYPCDCFSSKCKSIEYGLAWAKKLGRE